MKAIITEQDPGKLTVGCLAQYTQNKNLIILVSDINEKEGVFIGVPLSVEGTNHILGVVRTCLDITQFNRFTGTLTLEND
jgi:hypothetical protein